ncbi:DUF1996 domain-containing protein [Sphingopyxis sp.]|uniref:DUF1996 domain-containing protein n=1 Tax=Sphingopyxis sp. TaxID=1908224 RepID=UPI001DE0EF0C|nr:DUF1996 domain-containing protein [Sphingopyxis sp.]MBW8295326.1 DUF1996 domain-containing protein [Sphingopyxis sp.]MBW8295331.1 DUF1996 domain-containing protein [Sphingopyxis sp.]
MKMLALIWVLAGSALSGDAREENLARNAGEVRQVPSGLPVASLLGPKRIPPSAAPDVVGAFRFLCGPGQLSYDDPIVYRGQPGKAHLHQFFGNLGANAHSTYESLRKSGESTCQNELNRSAYWMPAMLDGKGNVVRPDSVSIYYKRRPASDPVCKVAGKDCVGIPRGLRFVFGWDQTRPNEPQPENTKLFNFKCVNVWTPTTAAFPDMVEPMKACKPGQWLSATIATPQCWNGVDLDSSNHRSHLADMVRDRNSGKNACPASHPYIIPQFTMGVGYSIEAGDEPKLWHLSSDAMLPPALRRPGASFHSDYFEAWEDDIRLRWEAGCIDKLLNCSDGDLGDGQILSRGKHYPQRQVSRRLVAVPENADHGAEHHAANSAR